MAMHFITYNLMKNMAGLSTEEKIEEIFKIVTKLQETLIGNEAFAIPGVLKRLSKVEVYIENFKKNRNIERGIFIALTLVWTIIMGLWDKIF